MLKFGGGEIRALGIEHATHGVEKMLARRLCREGSIAILLDDGQAIDVSGSAAVVAGKSFEF